jgi:dolichol-phosphate mannosyltransferase
MDADLQNDPHDIPGMLAHLDRWDAVTGWRVNRAAGDSWVRRISARIANRVRNALSQETIQDSAGFAGATCSGGRLRRGPSRPPPRI